MKKLLSLKIIIPTLLLISIGTYLVSRSSKSAEIGGANVLGANSDEKKSAAIVVSSEVASTGSLGKLESTNVSWPGEIVSYGDADIVPSREGQIAELYVNIGDYVSVGQAIGRLNPPTSSLELVSLLADRKQGLVSARAQKKATKILVDESKKRLKEIESAINRSRETSVDVAEKEAVQNSNGTIGASKELEALKISREASINSAKAELDQAEALLPNKFNAARSAVKALSQRFSGAISQYGAAPDTPEKALTFQIDSQYGGGNSMSRGEYFNALSNLLRASNNEKTIPETEASEYVKASIKLIANTSSYNLVTTDMVTTSRNIIFEDEQILNEALNEYKTAQNDVKVKKAQLEKMTAEFDRDIIGAESNVKVSDAVLNTTESTKANIIAEADERFSKEKTALDAKVSELNRQLALADAEVAGAEAAYNTIATGVGGTMLATQSGIISAIYKKVGDYVTTDSKVATTSSKNIHDRFVRFRIPVDMQLPKKNDIVTIERPGFLLQPNKAKIIGVGLALDDNGSYQADAEFIESVDWPVNSSVRVIFSAVSNFVLAPLTAIWWDDEGTSKVWLIDDEGGIKSRTAELGRAIGDRIEIKKGLNEGDKFISTALPNLTDGLIVSESTLGGATDGAAKQPSEGHGHGDM